MAIRSGIVCFRLTALPPFAFLHFFLCICPGFGLCIHHGDQDHVENGTDGTAQLKHMHRFVQSKQYGADGIGSAHFLQKIIGNISCRQVGEDEGVHFAIQQFGERIILFQYFFIEGQYALACRTRFASGELLLPKLE